MEFTDTLVAEWHTSSRIGAQPDGRRQLAAFCDELLERLGWRATQKATLHASPRFGLSGWVPAEGGKALHYYVWDDADASFISLDVVGATHAQRDDVRACVESRLGAAPVAFTWKSLLDSSQWRDLAPSIHRQRLLAHGSTSAPLTGAQVEASLSALSEALDMRLLHVSSSERCAWCHWELSGCVVSWEEGSVAVNLYSCKPFDPQHALDTTVGLLGLTTARMHSF